MNFELINNKPYFAIKNIQIQQASDDVFSICFYPDSGFNSMNSNILKETKSLVINNVNSVI